MQRAMIVTGVVLLCLPMLFVGYLLLAIHSPKLDNTTKALGDSVSHAVATAIVNKAGYGKQAVSGLQRVIALDPDNAEAWQRLCWVRNANGPKQDALIACTRSEGLSPTASTLYQLGRAQEASGDECAADQTFTRASAAGSSSGGYDYSESMGRAALRCGDIYGAQAGLRLAIDLETKDLAQTDLDEDEAADERTDQANDRKYLAVALDLTKDHDGAKQACLAAEPKWSTCACALDSKGEVQCSGK